MRRLALTALLVLLPLTRAAAAPRVAELSATLKDDRVLLSFVLRDGLDRRLRERLESGLPAAITYQLELLEDRSWLDRPLERRELRVVATHDALAGEYRLDTRLDGELVATEVVRSLAAVAPALTRVRALPVFALGERLRGRRLLVRARAELGLRTVLGFIPVRVVTEWVESAKFRVPRGAG